MNIFAIGGLINAISVFILGGIVYFKNRKKEINVRYALFCFFVGFWSFCYFLWQASQDKSSALFWSRGLMVGAIFIPICFLHFVLLLLGLYENRKIVVSIGYLIFLLFFALDFTPLFVTDVKPKMFFKFWPEPGPVFAIFLLIWFWYCLYPCYLLIRDYRKFTGIKRQQIKYVLIGILIGYGSGSTNYFLWYNIPIPPYGNFIVPFFVGMMAYAVVRYRLLDIKLALTRAGLFAVVYALVLGIPLGLTGWGRHWLQGLFGANWYWAPVILAIILATSGPFIYLFLQQRAENILRKEQLQYQEELRDISSTMMLIKELDRLLKTIVLKVVDIVQVSWAAVYLKDEREQKYLLRYQRAKPGVEAELPQDFPLDSALIKHLYKERLPIIGEEIGASTLKIGLAVPCFIEDNLLGFLLLGDKPKGGMYTISDVNTFAFLANQTALAIENCQFYSQERQREHFRRIASLDRQIDCMAHEMDNPIHATLGVLGSIDIALDELKEIIPLEKMDYLKQKLSRVEFNAGRVSKMISAVKEFTKPTTGEITVITLQQIIDSFVAIINPQLHHYGINFTLDLPQEPLWLRANKVEIEQVLVNLGTNSVQAIKEAPKENKKEITLKAFPKEISTLRIDFSDTGSGIEEKLLEDIFLDFVTTKASSEGTGLGLAISRKIISRHKGKIWAESGGPAKGAIFHIEIPIANDVTEEEKRKFQDEQNEDKRRELI